MVARDHDGRNPGVGKAEKMFDKLALLGGRGAVALVGVAGEEHQIHFVRQGVIDHLPQALRKILQTRVQARLGIRESEILHAEMGIGEMQASDGVRHEWIYLNRLTDKMIVILFEL